MRMLEKEQVRRFIALRDLLKDLITDMTVYRFGTTAIEVFVVGHDETARSWESTRRS